MEKVKLFFIAQCWVFFISGTFPVQSQITLQVDVSKPVTEIQPTMWGIFFEDINFAADGGIYAEMVKNRSFDFDERMMGWLQPNSDRHSLNENSGMATVFKEGSDRVNHYVRVEVKNSSGYQLINEGFRGMGVKANEKYNLSLKARKGAGGISKVIFQLIDASGNTLGETSVSPDSEKWKEYEAVIIAKTTEAKAMLKITFEGSGVIEMDMISLFAEDTWMGRPKGMRKDLVQLLADLNPGFLRFPGGCIVEGRTLETRYQWKKTVGNIEDREMIINRWNTEFAHRSTPDYFQSFGLGFFEYFQLAADMGAEPLPILSCGMACQFNTAELVPLDELDPYVQDALDLIEFANGGVNSEWGKIRAEMGHPEPFNLKYVGIGNEQWGPDYFDRLKIFTETIKAKYPEIIIVSGTGPFPNGEHFDYAEKELRKLNAEIVDEHYYRPPQWFLDNASRYDSYERSSYKIFAGEYAAHVEASVNPKEKNNWYAAMAEAAFLTGLERNADVVHLTSYAPLFAHVDGWQWAPDLIWFDNLSSYGTPNYYVQKLFSTNKGTKLVPVTANGKSLTGQNELYASSVIDEKTKEIVVKVVNTGANDKSVKIALKGTSKIKNRGDWTLLHSDDLQVFNSIENPEAIVPVEKEIAVKGKNIELTLPPYSLSIVKVKQE